MANLGDVKPLNTMIFEIGGDEYVFTGGGGGQPGPDSVGNKELKNDAVDTNKIVNGGVMMEDLNSEVKDSIADRVTEEDLDNFDV